MTGTHFPACSFQLHHKHLSYKVEKDCDKVPKNALTLEIIVYSVGLEPGVHNCYSNYNVTTQIFKHKCVLTDIYIKRSKAIFVSFSPKTSALLCISMQ